VVLVRREPGQGALQVFLHRGEDMRVNSTSNRKAARVDYVDWLRVVTTLCVFVFHSARFFDRFSDWHVKNGVTWMGASIIVAFMSMWIMPMFMVLAGAGTYYSLRSRNARQYIGERVLRLLVPFLFGVAVVTAPQRYYELLYREKLSCGNLVSCYPSYLLCLPQRFAHFGFYHLWFLALLFIFSLICLPLFVKGSKSLFSALASRINSPWVLMPVLVLPLAVIDTVAYPGAFWGNRTSFGGWCLIAYVSFFLSGYVIFASPGIAECTGKLSRFAGAAIVVGIIALIPLRGPLLDWKSYFGTASYGAAQLAQALLSWGLLIGFITLGRRVFTFKNRFLAYASEAVLPFYILHQTVIIMVGYYVVRWELHPALKYVIIALVSFTLVMGLYDLLIRRIKVLRFLFGMRGFRKSG